MQEVRKRGVPLAEGFGKHPWDLTPDLDGEIRAVYADAKKCIRAELSPEFLRTLTKSTILATTSKNRDDYLLHPQTGEHLDEPSQRIVRDFRKRRDATRPVQLVVSDGLNAFAITDRGNLHPYLENLRRELAAIGLSAATEILVVRNGRVRVGYRIGEALFGESADSDTHRAIVHIIGERPGSMHHTFSAYLTASSLSIWNQSGRTDHNITRVVSGIAADAFTPQEAAALTAKILRELFSRSADGSVAPRLQ